MNGLARVVVMGNLTRDPELRSAGDLSICSLSMACNERVKKAGEWTDYVSFYDVTVFGNQADSTAQYLTKGSPVAVDGRLRQERWEKDGQKRSAVKIVADSVTFLPTGEKRDRPPDDPPSDGTPDDDDIPF